MNKRCFLLHKDGTAIVIWSEDDVIVKEVLLVIV